MLRHLDEYFDGDDVPKALDLGIDVAEHVPFGKRSSARVARRNIARMAEQFIVGQTAGRGGRRAAPAVAAGERPHRRPPRREDDRRGRGRPLRAPACDEMLRVALRRAPTHWAPDDHLERDDLGPLPRVNVSIKPTALATPLRAAHPRARASSQAKERIRPLLRLARERGAFVTSTWSTTTPRTSRSSCSASCSARTSSPTCTPASSSRPT